MKSIRGEMLFSSTQIKVDTVVQGRWDILFSYLLRFFVFFSCENKLPCREPTKDHAAQ